MDYNPVPKAGKSVRRKPPPLLEKQQEFMEGPSGFAQSPLFKEPAPSYNYANYINYSQQDIISPTEINYGGFDDSSVSLSQTLSTMSVATPSTYVDSASMAPPVPAKPPKDMYRRKSFAISQFLGDDYDRSTNTNNNNYHSINSDYNSSFNSFESDVPRPMGPKELPEYYNQNSLYKSNSISYSTSTITPTIHSPYASIYDNGLQPETPLDNLNNIERSYYQPYNTPYPLEETDYITSSPECARDSPEEYQSSQKTSIKLPQLNSGSLLGSGSTPIKINNRNQTLRTPGSSKSNSPTKSNRQSPTRSKSSWSVSSKSSSPRKYASIGNFTNLDKSLEDLHLQYSDNTYDYTKFYEPEEFRSPTLSSGWNSDQLEQDESSIPSLPQLPPHSPNPSKIEFHTALSTIRKKNDELPPIPLDLPALPFSSSSLVSTHFAKCERVWSLTEIYKWCQNLTIWLHDSLIPRAEFRTALLKLVVFHRPCIPIETVEHNVDYILETFVSSYLISYKQHPENLDKSEEIVVFHKPIRIGRNYNDEEEEISFGGILVELTNCYCSHNEESKFKCYASQCYTNKISVHEEKLESTSIDELVLGSDWPTHWKLTAEALGSFEEKEVRKQCQIFDLIRRENQLVIDGRRFINVYGKSFLNQKPALIGDPKKFHSDAFAVLDPFIDIHKKYLVDPLLDILMKEGKLITSISEIAEIFIEWTNVARMPFLKYSGKFEMVKQIASHEKFKAWLYNVDPTDKERERYFTRTFFKPVTETPLTLKEIGSDYPEDSAEYQSVMKAVKLIKKLGEKIEQMQLHTEKIQNLKAINQQLLWKPNFETRLNLGSENRELIKRGDVLRKGDLKINSYAVHLILLDNFLVIADHVKSSRSLKFRVSERPIPIEFLLVEVKDETSYSPIDIKQTKDLLKTASSVSDTLGEDLSSFPFKIRFAGRGKHNAFTFLTKSDTERIDWLNALEKARSQLCGRLNKGDPFTLRVISDSTFAYEELDKPSKLPICAPNDPVDIACNSISRVELAKFPRPLFVSRVLSSATFSIGSKLFHLIGLKYGVYANEAENPRVWKRVLDLGVISQISVLVEMNLVIVLSNKLLLYYPLDSLLSVYKGKKVKISGTKITNKEVSFYKVGQHKGMTMIFYAKTRGTSSTIFKVIIPQTDNGGVFSSFSVAKKFYIQAECFGISIFNTTFAIHSTKGLEILDLDKLIPRSVPELPNIDQSKKIDGYSRKPLSNGVELIKKAMNSTSVKPMGMFKLSNNSEFLLVYNDCAIFTNKHGKLSRFSMLRFEFKAKKIAFYSNYLFLVCDEVAEIWSISNEVTGTNKLIQVITGKEMNLISSDGKPTFVLAHPKVPGRQLVVQLAENDFTTKK